MTIKEQLHELVDQLTEEQSEEVLDYVLRRIDVPEVSALDLGAESSERRGKLLISGAEFNRMPRIGLATLAAQQGIKPVSDFESLFGDFWPGDEDDDFDAVLREWRDEG